MASAELKRGPQRRRRPQRSRGWLRVRDRESLRVHGLQLDVHSLRSEIEALRVTRNLLYMRALNRRDDADGSYVRMVRQYGEIVRHGYQDGRLVQVVRGGSRATVNIRDVMHAIMDPDLRMGRFLGLEQFLRMSQAYTSAYHPISHELLQVEVAPSRWNPLAICNDDDQVMVRATTHFEGSITPDTIRLVFPHLQGNARLLRQLLGRTFAGGSRFDFVFDTHTDRIVRVDVDFDLVAAFAALLRDIRDVEVVFRGALLTPDGGIGDPRTYVVVSEEEKRDGAGAGALSDERRMGREQEDAGGDWQMKISALLNEADAA